MRSDAQRNRERLLVAAEELFLERGADTSLDDVAKRAKVGIGTLYRRFPTRDALLAAMCDERLLAIAEASRARGGGEPVSALRGFIEELVAATNKYRGLAALFGAVLQHPTRGCAATTEEGGRLLHRAQAAGLVRQDVSMEDIVCVITAVSLATAELSDASPRIAHLVGLFLEGALERRSRR